MKKINLTPNFEKMFMLIQFISEYQHIKGINNLDQDYKAK